MKKLLLTLLLISAPTVAKDTVLGQSYAEIGFNIGNSVLVNNTTYNYINLGGTAIFGIDWDFISHIFALELFQYSMSFLISSGYEPVIPIGFEGNLRFFNMALGDTKNTYDYFIYILGIGMDVQFAENKNSNLLILNGGVEILLPLGFKILLDNNMYFYVKHSVIIPFFQIHPIKSYMINFSMGYRFDIKSRVSGLK